MQRAVARSILSSKGLGSRGSFQSGESRRFDRCFSKRKLTHIGIKGKLRIPSSGKDCNETPMACATDALAGTFITAGLFFRGVFIVGRLVGRMVAIHACHFAVCSYRVVLMIHGSMGRSRHDRCYDHRYHHQHANPFSHAKIILYLFYYTTMVIVLPKPLKMGIKDNGYKKSVDTN